MGPAVLATACGAVGIIFIRVASSTLGASAYGDLATEAAFFAAWSLLGAGLIQAARRPPRPPR
jgi:hypothetical protein